MVVVIALSSPRRRSDPTRSCSAHSRPKPVTNSPHSPHHTSHQFPQRADIHPPHVKQQALDLIAAGLNDCEVSRRTGVPRTTIRDWRRPTYVARNGAPARETCPRCWGRAKPVRFTPADYSELLAIYLGDGCISEYARTQRLRISLDKKYPRIIAEIRVLLERCFPHNRVDEVGAIGCVQMSVYSSHLACVFPQHAAGRKHERRIALEPWQQELVDAEPWPFVRGCIRTDGCVFINRTNVHRYGPYEYLSYDFSNKSTDIVDLMRRACQQVGVRTRASIDRNGVWKVRINRRDSVALMLEHVGLKT